MVQDREAQDKVTRKRHMVQDRGTGQGNKTEAHGTRQRGTEHNKAEAHNTRHRHMLQDRGT